MNYVVNLTGTLEQIQKWWMMFWVGGMSNMRHILHSRAWHLIIWQFLVHYFFHYIVVNLKFHIPTSNIHRCRTYLQQWPPTSVACSQSAGITVNLCNDMPKIVEQAGSGEGFRCICGDNPWWGWGGWEEWAQSRLGWHRISFIVWPTVVASYYLGLQCFRCGNSSIVGGIYAPTRNPYPRGTDPWRVGYGLAQYDPGVTHAIP